MTAAETRAVLTAGYVEDLEPLGDLFPLIRTETPTDRQEPDQ